MPLAQHVVHQKKKCDDQCQCKSRCVLVILPCYLCARSVVPPAPGREHTTSSREWPVVYVVIHGTDRKLTPARQDDCIAASRRANSAVDDT